MTTRVEVIRANANDDQLQLIEVHVADGQEVAEGDLLFILETTKAAVEILAPVAGHVRLKAGRVGDFVTVGALLCEIAETVPALDDAVADILPEAMAAATSGAEICITAKARKIAAAEGIGLDEVAPVDGRIGEAEVRAALSGRKAGASRALQAPAPQVPAVGGARRAIVVGGGGHAACIIDALEGTGYDIVGCTDQRLPIGHPVYRGVCVVGREEDLAAYRADGVDHAFIGVGGAESSLARRKLFERAAGLGFVLPPAVHPRAVVAAGSTLGAGCHVLAGATVGPRCTIGRNVIVNQGSIVCHDSHIDDHAHLTPGAIVAGGVTIGAMSVVGMGATVLFKVAIGENCLVHNGAHVNNDIEDDTILDARGIRRKR